MKGGAIPSKRVYSSELGTKEYACDSHNSIEFRLATAARIDVMQNIRLSRHTLFLFICHALSTARQGTDFT